MSGKEKKYKYVEDVVEEYIRLMDEQIEVPLLKEKAKKKQDVLFLEIGDKVVKKDDAEDLFKAHTQIKKCEERKNEINEDIKEVEEVLKDFLASLNGRQLAYERKDDAEKLKITYLFWLENGVLKCNR